MSGGGDPLALELAQRLCRELDGARADDRALRRGLVADRLRRLVAAARPAAAGAADWLERLRARLHDGYVAQFDHRELAHFAGVHPTHMVRRFRQRYGCTIGEYLRRLRIVHATALLHRSTLSLSEIACAAGFADQAHMQRRFKSLTGVTPGRWRRDVANRSFELTPRAFKTATGGAE